MRFVSTWSVRSFALASAVALGLTALVGVVLALREPPFPAGSFEARDHQLAFGAVAVWGFAFAALAAFFLYFVLERSPENALGPEPEVRLLAQAGGVLAGAGAGIGWALLPALIVSPSYRTLLVALVLVGLLVLPAIGVALAASAYRRETDEFDAEGDTRSMTPARRIVPKETARPAARAPTAGAPARAPPPAGQRPPPGQRPPQGQRPPSGDPWERR